MDQLAEQLKPHNCLKQKVFNICFLLYLKDKIYHYEN